MQDAISLGRFTTETDVWSYGIVLHEIWSLGERPYGKWSDRKISKAVSHGYRLPAPQPCPREIYQAMIKCWHPDPELRPSFSHLRVTLKSYSPGNFDSSRPTKCVAAN